MPEFVGLSKQEVMALMVNDANIKIKDMLKEREDASIKMIQEEMKKRRQEPLGDCQPSF